ncbi:30S ribosomal protein S9 [Patescibacteria group bacterium]|nr:30S ribosomal protein S9 [Patescibacteria group bacterium]
MKTPAGNYFEGIGRRKVAIARVRLYVTKGDFLINGLAAGQYFDEVPNASALYNRPLVAANLLGNVSLTVKVSGSGIRSQLDAVVLGIARALVKYDPELKTVLKAEGLMTRDDRMKETRKVGMGGKARRSRQSPKR